MQSIINTLNICNLKAKDIDFINAHGTATGYNDGNWHLAIVGWDAVDTIFCDIDGGVERKNKTGASSRMGTSGEATTIGGYQEWDGNLDEPTPPQEPMGV